MTQKCKPKKKKKILLFPKLLLVRALLITATEWNQNREIRKGPVAA